MKFTTSILVITLIASLSAFKLRADDGVHTEPISEVDSVAATGTSASTGTSTAAATGACTKGSCAACDKNGAAKFCTTCYKKNISGSGDNRKCDGAAPTGCLTTVTGSNGQAYCSICDTKNNYQLILNVVDKTKNTCVKCDLSANYLSGVECKTATKVSNCATYGSDGNCQTCKAKYQLQANACNQLPTNCSYMDADKACKACVPKYYLKDGKCTSITIKNCLSLSPTDQTKCQVCDSGFYVKDGTCASIGVSNCETGTGDKKCADCKPGYLLKDDGSACSELKSCSLAVYGTSIQCVQCNTLENQYFATDVKGDATITYKGQQKWEQVCTKASNIATFAAFITAISIALF